MPKIALLIIALAVVPTVGVQKTRRGRPTRNRMPIIQSFTASQAQIPWCSKMVVRSSSCPESGEIVVLQVKASDPDNQTLSYKYSVTGGVISGEGPIVNWNLAGSRLEGQTATVEVVDSQGARAFTSARVELIMCSGCEYWPCPVFQISCPSSVAEGEIAKFESNVSPIDDDQKLVYLWSHSNGERLPAQPGPTLLIKAVGRPGQVITSTLEILGFDPSCNRQASCKTTITKRIP